MRSSTWTSMLQTVRERRAALQATRPQHTPSKDQPPEIPNINDVLRRAQESSKRVATTTAALAAWREGVAMFREVQEGRNITPMRLFKAARNVSNTSSNAASATWRRHILVTGLDTAARIIARKTAERAGQDAITRAIHVCAKRLAGRMGYALTAFEIFRSMKRDLRRFRDGTLSEEDLYRNCALTAVSIAAPLVATAVGGPIASQAGLTIAIGASMLKK